MIKILLKMIVKIKNDKKKMNKIIMMKIVMNQMKKKMIVMKRKKINLINKIKTLNWKIKIIRK